MSTSRITFLVATLVLGASSALSGCDLFREEHEGTLERVGSEIDDSAEDVEDAVEDLGEDIDESAQR